MLNRKKASFERVDGLTIQVKPQQPHHLKNSQFKPQIATSPHFLNDESPATKNRPLALHTFRRSLAFQDNPPSSQINRLSSTQFPILSP